MEKTTITCYCGMCGATNAVTVNTKDLLAWRSKKKLIQEAFKYLNKVQREMIKTGYCPDCQKWLFG